GPVAFGVRSMIKADPERFLCMSADEQRLFDNVKKALAASDRAREEGRAEDFCLQELCKALDAAKSLRRLLLQPTASNFAKSKHSGHRKEYIEFLDSELPPAASGGFCVSLADECGQRKDYSLSELIYEIRCKIVHENENLNIAE